MHLVRRRSRSTRVLDLIWEERQDLFEVKQGGRKEIAEIIVRNLRWRLSNLELLTSALTCHLKSRTLTMRDFIGSMR